jgi:hypothetical protein
MKKNHGMIGEPKSKGKSTPIPKGVKPPPVIPAKAGKKTKKAC